MKMGIFMCVVWLGSAHPLPGHDKIPSYVTAEKIEYSRGLGSSPQMLKTFFSFSLNSKIKVVRT